MNEPVQTHTHSALMAMEDQLNKELISEKKKTTREEEEGGGGGGAGGEKEEGERGGCGERERERKREREMFPQVRIQSCRRQESWSKTSMRSMSLVSTLE